MTMFKSLMLALAVIFSGAAFASETTVDCPEGSEAPECQMEEKEGSGS